jgi:integrase
MDLFPVPVAQEVPVARRAPKEESGRGATEAVEDLRQMLLEMRSELRELLPNRQSAAPLPALTLADVVAEWLPRKLQEIAAPETFEGRVRLHILPALGRHTRETLLPLHVEDMMKGMLKAGLARQTVNHVRDAGRQLIDWALKNKRWGGENPFTETPKLKIKWVKETLRLDEAAKLLRFGLDTHWRPLFALALYLGPRRKTIFNIRVDDVHMERKLIDFRVTKTGDPILGVPIPDLLMPFLEQALKVARGPWLFSQKNGRQMSSKSHVLNTALEDAIDRVGIKREGRAIHLTFHGLRRCSSTLHQQAGCHPWVVSKVLGHSQESLALFGNLRENMTAKSYSDFEEHFVRSELNKLKIE